MTKITIFLKRRANFLTIRVPVSSVCTRVILRFSIDEENNENNSLRRRVGKRRWPTTVVNLRELRRNWISCASTISDNRRVNMKSPAACITSWKTRGKPSEREGERAENCTLRIYYPRARMISRRRLLSSPSPLFLACDRQCKRFSAIFHLRVHSAALRPREPGRGAPARKETYQ